MKKVYTKPLNNINMTLFVSPLNLNNLDKFILGLMNSYSYKYLSITADDAHNLGLKEYYINNTESFKNNISDMIRLIKSNIGLYTIRFNIENREDIMVTFNEDTMFVRAYTHTDERLNEITNILRKL